MDQGLFTARRAGVAIFRWQMIQHLTVLYSGGETNPDAIAAER